MIDLYLFAVLGTIVVLGVLVAQLSQLGRDTEELLGKELPDAARLEGRARAFRHADRSRSSPAVAPAWLGPSPAKKPAPRFPRSRVEGVGPGPA